MFKIFRVLFGIILMVLSVTLLGQERIASEFKYHKVKKGETLYSLANLYDVMISDIQQYNPKIRRNKVRRGKTIKIPVFSQLPMSDSGLNEVPVGGSTLETEQVVTKPVSGWVGDSPKSFERYYDIKNRYYSPGSSLKMAMVLPLMTSYSEDSISYVDKRSIPFMEMYEGALIALEELKHSGVDVEFSIYDSGRSIETVSNLVETVDFSKYDVVIGPVFNQLQGPVVEKTKGLFVSPLASNEYYGVKDNYLSVVPSEKFIDDRLIDYVVDSLYNENIIIVSPNSNMLSEKMSNLKNRLYSERYFDAFNSNSFKQIAINGAEGMHSLKSLVSEEKENVILIDASEETDINSVISYLISLDSEFKIRVIGSSRWLKFKSVSLDNLHKLNLTYLNYYSEDYERAESLEFDRRYKDLFKGAPSKYSVQGYDVTKYFGQLFVMKDFKAARGVQVKFDIRSDEDKNLSNQGLFIMTYCDDYSMKIVDLN